MNTFKKSLLLSVMALSVASAYASTYQFKMPAKGVRPKPAVVASAWDGAMLTKNGTSVGTSYGAGIYLSDVTVSTGVVYYEAEISTGSQLGDSFFGFVEASHSTPTNGSYFRLNSTVFNSIGTFDISQLTDKTEFSPYVVPDTIGGYNGPATIGVSVNFNTRIIKIYTNNVLKYTMTNLPAGIQLRAAKSWQGAGVIKFAKASWKYNPEGL